MKILNFSFYKSDLMNENLRLDLVQINYKLINCNNFQNF